MYRFDEESHSYYVGDQRIPGVTQLLSNIDDGYRYVCDATMEYARQRGVAVHRACELLDKDDLDESSLAPVVRPYVEAYRRFRLETGFAPTHIERRMFHPTLRFGGTLDRIGTLRGRNALVDLKAVAALMPTTAIQTAAYAELARVTLDERIEERRALQLKPDGTYRLSPPYTGVDDLRVFLALLTIHNYREKQAC